MKCEEVERAILQRDAAEHLLPATAAHIAGCPSCRALAERLETVERSVRLAERPDVREIDLVMAAIDAAAPDPTGPHSLARWVVGGVLLIAALLAVPHSRSFALFAEGVFGSRVELSVGIAIGLLLVGYLAAFVTANGRRLEEIIAHLPGGREHGHR